MDEYCPSCQSPVDVAAKFCGECGYGLQHAAFNAGLQASKNSVLTTAPPPSTLKGAANAQPTTVVARMLCPGMVISDRIEIQARLKDGGLNSVWRGIDRHLKGMPCAVKVVGYNPGADAAELYQLKSMLSKEADTLLALKPHPHICRLLAFLTDDALGVQCLVMEYIPGPDLLTYLQQYRASNPTQSGLPAQEVIAHGIALCDALAHLHNAPTPIIFRDIKPDNIIRRDVDQQIVLVDFGIARPSNSATARLYASKDFAAPEQLAMDDAEPSADIYAAGSTLYYLLSGVSHRQRSPGEDARLRTEQRDLYAIIDKATNADARKRYTDAREMRQALEQLHDGRLAAPGASTMTPAPRARPTTRSQAATVPNGAIPPRTVMVDAGGQGHYRTIGEALARCPAGFTILVRSGTYKESLMIDRTVRIEGAGDRDSVRIEAARGPAVTAMSRDVTIVNLTLVGPPTTAYAVDIPQGNALLQSCAITSHTASCIAVHGRDAAPTLQHCEIEGRSPDASGVIFYDSAQGTVRDCRVIGRARSVIAILGQARPHLYRCRIAGGAGSGILIAQGSGGKVEECIVEGHAKYGIFIAEGSAPAIYSCVVRGNKEGIFIKSDSAGTRIVNSESSNNSRRNIECEPSLEMVIDEATRLKSKEKRWW